MKKILVTGGLGYIGSFTVLSLQESNYEVVIVDNLSNSSIQVIDRIEGLSGIRPKFYENDFADITKMREIIDSESIQAVIHFAAFKYVGESVERPLDYFRNNVSGFIALLNLLQEKNLPIVFSSSATVYGAPTIPHVTEQAPCNPESPYGWSKFMNEVVLEAAAKGNQPISGIALRYFNVVGAHSSGKLGEQTIKPSPMLIPSIIRTLHSDKPLQINGNDYPTPDGTCLRDYIHVVDLADAHLAALEHLFKQSGGYYEAFNVGTGVPSSVLDIVKTFEAVNGVKIPLKFGPKRPGDAPAYYAAAEKAKEVLGWSHKLSLEDCVRDAWTWAQNS